LEEIEKKTVSAIQITENESQTDDYEDETLVQVNKNLKRALHKVRNQIQRVVTERPDLFDGIGEDSNERLDHLILIVEYQAVQIDALQAERDHVEEQLREANKELQRYKKIICNVQGIPPILIFLALWKHIGIKSKMSVQ
jgi:hypothetical protein